MSMVTELGADYFCSRFNGSFFFGPSGNPMVLDMRSADHVGRVIPAYEVGGTYDDVTKTATVVPADFFTDMSVFATPSLGWRSSKDGKFMVRFARNNRSYHRGVSNANIERNVAGHSNYLLESGVITRMQYSAYICAHVTALMVMKPEYVSMAEGLTAMNEGRSVGFALSPLLAVVPDAGDDYGILFRDLKVGTVTPEGVMSFTVPFHSKLLEVA